MGISKRSRDNDDQLHPNDSNPNHKKMKTKTSILQNNRDIPQTTTQPETQKSLNWTSLGERVKLRHGHTSDASVRRDVDQFSDFDQNGTLVEQVDKETKVSYSTVDEENENGATTTGEAQILGDEALTTSDDEGSDTTIDARTDGSNEDLVATAEALINIGERHAVPSASPERAAEALLLFAAHDIRAASEEVVATAGSYAGASGGCTETGEQRTTNEPQTTLEVQLEVQVAAETLARLHLTRPAEAHDVITADDEASAAPSTWKPRVARISAIIADEPGPSKPFGDSTQVASKAYSPSPLSASTTPSASEPGPTPAETAETARLARLAHIDTLMIPRCPVQRYLLGLQHTLNAKQTIYKWEGCWYGREGWRREILEWMQLEREIRGMGMGEWENVCDFEDDWEDVEDDEDAEG
ncbi:hypothetical protein VE01_01258 [Pseudogymnoascus verrucosus]|uniref:Uncharacterized protein n=1 Tax=Pseudogymnoascus verrucosus TaxID=342668 RepID=A0A1B8GYB6_9PEZI|nr:uncharacterized protein VE01_01258 [Pseudogymnoascus verrucosus]OBU00824.1 hypothetical protein VE01_01258 [Pseudogymnoascus verrucosus]